MLSPTYRKPRVSRRQEIPGNLVLNWQSSAARGAKPLIRRPKTACERCRTAKVKCHGNGRHDCDRCASRGLSCKYLETPPSMSPASSRSPSVLDRGNPELEESQMDFDGDHPTDQFGGDSAAFQHLLGSSAYWPDMEHQTESPEQHQQQQQQQQQQQMDWSVVDPALDWTIGMNTVEGLDLGGGFSSASTTPSNSLGGSTTNTAITTPTAEQRASLSSLGLLPLITNANPPGASWHNQLSSQGCQCRAGLAQLVPNARAALQKRRLGGVFEVTSDIIQQCQGMVSCENCKVNCTDLICIMAVFQEADVCFDYIAKGDIDCPISISLGSYDMAADDQDAKQWRQMLVIQLERRANSLLDSISARGQAMLKDLDPECRLGRVNINYLQAVIENSRENFRRIMKGFRDEAKRKE